jgi:hypothetical protein
MTALKNFRRRVYEKNKMLYVYHESVFAIDYCGRDIFNIPAGNGGRGWGGGCGRGF